MCGESDRLSTMMLQSTVASIQNIRKQRQLELELVELERKWHVELKVIARERLGVLKELCRISQDRQDMDHFHAGMHGKDLTRFTDLAQGRQQQAKELKQLHKFDFQPDPVEKMPVRFPLITQDGVAKVLTAKELSKHRIQLQKSNFEQCMADRRNRRRPFWDKAVLGSKKKDFRKERQFGGFPNRVLQPLDPIKQPVSRVPDPPEPPHVLPEYDELRTRGALTKSPSLPALNTLRRLDTDKPKVVHPSLSNRLSASMDYLPVIKGTRGHHGFVTSLKAPSVSAPTALPTIVEGGT